MRGWRAGLALGAGAALVLSGLSCASVLGLDEPTHRGTGGNQGAAGGGDSGSGGGSSSGGAAGTIESSGGGGGSSGSNATGSGGMSGAGGSSAGAAPDAGDASAPRDAGAAPGACQGLQLCDNFESTAVGSVPEPTKWSIDPNSPVPNIAIDSAQASRGTKSVKIQPTVGAAFPMMFYNKVPLAIGTMWYIRVYVYVSVQGGGSSAGGFLALRDTEDPNRYLVLGFNSGALAYSFQGAGTYQAILPSSGGQLMSSYRLETSKWICMEMRYDAANTQIHTWVDGVDIAALRADGTATPGVDDVWTNMMPPFRPSPTVGFGWWPLQGSSATVYLDDVAIDESRIGCY